MRIKDMKITQFYYRPLELDNDSSSESSDALKRRRTNDSQNKNNKPESPLAIKASATAVTPNVPRIRNSFFNRKFRESGGSVDQLMITTPRVINKGSGKKSSGSSSKSRSRKDVGKSSGDGNNRLSGRPTRSRPSTDELFEPDFSTPRATRASLLTPMRNEKISFVQYRPLELDNDSSSEVPQN